MPVWKRRPAHHEEKASTVRERGTPRVDADILLHVTCIFLIMTFPIVQMVSCRGPPQNTGPQSIACLACPIATPLFLRTNWPSLWWNHMWPLILWFLWWTHESCTLLSGQWSLTQHETVKTLHETIETFNHISLTVYLENKSCEKPLCNPWGCCYNIMPFGITLLWNI